MGMPVTISHQLDFHVISLSLDDYIAKTQNRKFDPNVIEPINPQKKIMN